MLQELETVTNTETLCSQSKIVHQIRGKPPSLVSEMYWKHGLGVVVVFVVVVEENAFLKSLSVLSV